MKEKTPRACLHVTLSLICKYKYKDKQSFQSLKGVQGKQLEKKIKVGTFKTAFRKPEKTFVKKIKNMGNLENTEKSGKSWAAEKIIRVKTFKTVVRHLVTQLPQTAAPPHPPHLCSSLSPYRSAKYIQRTQNVQRGLGCLKFKFLPFLPIFKKKALCILI